MKAPLDPALCALLGAIDTPSVCNAIEVAQGQRGFAAFTRGTPIASHPGAPAIFGRARTARIAGASPSSRPRDALRAMRRDYLRYMHGGPRPAVAVVEDIDFPECVGAWWGEVNSVLHKAQGLSGALTNGVLRDLGDLAPGFPILAGSLGPSHGFVRVEDIGGPVEVFGLRVTEGDIVHADRHGAVVIPDDVLPDLPAAFDRLTASEAIVLDAAQDPEMDIERLLEAWTRFEAART